MQDEIYMSRALKLAKRGCFTTHPNPNVGCVIVKNNVIIGEGFHYRAGEDHAEIHALRMAGKKAEGATVYVTLEPCSHYGRTPPCCDALIDAKVFRVVIAMYDPNPQVSGCGIFRLKQKGIKVNHGLMEKDAEKLNKGFLKRVRTGLPYVQIKLGASLDGRTAMMNGESQWITSIQARRDVQSLRAQSHAILTSSTTVLSDDPSLTVRWDELNKNIQDFYPKKDLRQPLRIIIDSRNRITPKYRIIQQPSEILFARIKKDTQCWPMYVRQTIIPEYNGYIDLKLLMSCLGKQEINTILVEAGPTMVGALIQANLVDELIIYIAPRLLGEKARSLCILSNIEVLNDTPQFIFTKVRLVGPDLCLHLTTV